MLSQLQSRQARPASLSWIICKTLGQMAIFWTIFLYLLPSGIFALEQAWGLAWWRFTSPTSFWVGLALFLFGACLGLTSALVMASRGRGTPMPTDCASELVLVGPYRYVRNPMAIAGLAKGVAVGLMMGSPAVIAFALLGGPIWHWFVRPWEEADLERRFGTPYRQYRHTVRCWLPRFRA